MASKKNKISKAYKHYWNIQSEQWKKKRYQQLDSKTSTLQASCGVEL